MSNTDKSVKFSILLDYYGALLTEKQRDIVSLYYDEDFSLGEISENKGITRQAVLDTIRKSEKNLLEFEEKLGLHKRFSAIEVAVQSAKKQTDNSETIRLLDEIIMNLR